jgi:hypothetical protein
VRGSGTVVTGTLGAGVLRTGDELRLGERTVRVRGLQRLGTACDEVAAVARVAVNLRGVERTDVARGDALLTPDAWRTTGGVDVRLSSDPRDLPSELVLHVGSTAVAVRLRPLGADTARLLLHRALPLRAGDRALLRDPGAQAVAAGVLVLDADPPALRRRGAAADRAEVLRDATGRPDLAAEVHRRGVVRGPTSPRSACPLDDLSARARAGGVARRPGALAGVVGAARRAVDAHASAAPLEAGLPAEAARQALGLPGPRLLPAARAAAGLERSGGRLRRPGRRRTSARPSRVSAALEQRLRADPFAAPRGARPGRAAARARELAAAERAGRLLRLRDDVVLLPGRTGARDAGAGRAAAAVHAQPARQALGTTRRVAVPLLEHLDGRGWTRRLDAGLREVRAEVASGRPTRGAAVAQEVRGSSRGARALPVTVETIVIPDPGAARGGGEGGDLRGLPHRPALPRGRHQRRVPLPARPRGRRAGRDRRRRGDDVAPGRPGGAGLAAPVRRLPGLPARPALVLLRQPAPGLADDAAGRHAAVARASGSGAFAEKTLVGRGRLHQGRRARRPAAAGLLGCGVMAGWGAAVNTAPVQQGDTVAVLGCGGVGDAAIAGASTPARAGHRRRPRRPQAGVGQGVRRDRHGQRRQRRRRAGAARAHRRLRPDVVIDAVGRPETYRQAFDARDLAGTVVLVGVPTPQMQLEMPLIEFFGHGGR